MATNKVLSQNQLPFDTETLGHKQIHVAYDFSINKDQDMALMPAWFAYALIDNYKNSLMVQPLKVIIGGFIDDLREAMSNPVDGVKESIRLAKEYVERRTILDNLDREGFFAVNAVLQDVTAEQMTTI